VKVYVLHENPEWYPPFAAAFDAAGVEHEQWLLGEGSLDLDEEPPTGVFWSRMSASSHTRGHLLAKDHARAVFSWLESHGRRVVNGRRVLELEMSKADQLTALRASGIDVPRTVAVVGRGGLLDTAGKFAAPFIVKHNQGGKGIGVRRFDSVSALELYLDSSEYEPPVDGITLVQEYLEAAEPFITRVEIVGGEFVYAITADTARGGFELCPADACAVDPGAVDPDADAGDGSSESLFALREGIAADHPMVARYRDFSRRLGLEIAGFEFIETADGRSVTYDVNTNTNYNPQVEAVADRSGPGMVAHYLKGLLDASEGGR
jgi:glutathione synthase/RimK-type ligase-like ATP-grasp enzyme